MMKIFASWYIKFSASGSFCLVMLLILQGTVFLTWNANEEPDLSGYKLYYGRQSKQYTSVIDVGLVTSYNIENLKGGKYYYFALTAYDFNGNESLFSEEISIYIEGKNPALHENFYNYPNPFNPEIEKTRIRYLLPESELVTIKIYDCYGECISTIIDNEDKSAGEHVEDRWDGRDNNGKIVQNGVYYCSIKTASRNDFISVVVLK